MRGGSDPTPNATRPLPAPGRAPGCELGVAPCSLLLKANHLEESFGVKAAFKGNIGRVSFGCNSAGFANGLQN